MLCWGNSAINCCTTTRVHQLACTFSLRKSHDEHEHIFFSLFFLFKRRTLFQTFQKRKMLHHIEISQPSFKITPVNCAFVSLERLVSN
mmetsp:Transcript_5615/g.16148  ORF Transcript_5615/g.16148 Transcript_5615/m.16148 type:complete len:88 (+) Transcript_5615:67-330(+)